MSKLARKSENFGLIFNFFVFVFVVPLFLGIQLQSRTGFGPFLKHDRPDLLDFFEFRLILFLLTILLDVEIKSFMFVFKFFQFHLRRKLRKVYLVDRLFRDAVCPLGQVGDETVSDSWVTA